jgi:putative DNA primase/helicase
MTPTLEQELKQAQAAIAAEDPGLRFFPYTDSGNAERIALKFAGVVRYCAPQRCWYLWTGRRWEPDQIGEMLQRTKLIARELYDEAGRLESADARKTCAEWARKCESADRRKAALFLAQSEPGIPVLPAEFDTDPFALNCLNGTVDLKTGSLREHRAADLITRLAPVEYDGTARSELWQRFVDDCTGGDHEFRDFLQRATGYSLTGSVREEVLFFVHGPAASGKSSFLETLKASFGDYAKVADFESFIARRDAGQIRNDIAELAGRRFVVSIEVDEGKKLAEGLVKLLTGGDTVRARFLYQEAFEFAPSFKLWLAANHAPRVRDNDSAIWRRILRLPFEHVVPKGQRDPTVKARLKDTALSGPAVLAWAVEGCMHWQEDGLNVPQMVEQANEQYRMDMDPLRLFFDERCGFEPDAWCSVAALRGAYEAWAKESGEHALNGRQFAERLRERGCAQKTTRAGRGWGGISLAKGEPLTC